LFCPWALKAFLRDVFFKLYRYLNHGVIVFCLYFVAFGTGVAIPVVRQIIIVSLLFETKEKLR